MSDAIENSSETAAKQVEQMATKVIVDVNTSVEDVLDFDSKGYFICFAAEPELFKELPEEVIEQLSIQTRSAYRAIYEVYVKLRDRDHSMDTPGIEFVRQYAAPGASAYEQIHGIQLKPGLVPHFTRVDRLMDRMSRGWRKPKPGEVLRSQAPMLDNSEQQRALKYGDNQVESLLLVKDADQERRDIAARDEKRLAMGDDFVKTVAEQVKGETGGDTSPYD